MPTAREMKEIEKRNKPIEACYGSLTQTTERGKREIVIDADKFEQCVRNGINRLMNDLMHRSSK